MHVLRATLTEYVELLNDLWIDNRLWFFYKYIEEAEKEN